MNFIQRLNCWLNADSIAIGNPAFVPAGVYAIESMIFYGLYAQLQPKLIFADNVLGVLNLVTTGQAQAGFVYNNDAVENPDVQVSFVVAEESHAPIIYPAAVIRSSQYRLASENFINFLRTEEAQQYFVEHGFNQIVFPKDCDDGCGSDCDDGWKVCVEIKGCLPKNLGKILGTLTK